MTLRVKRIWVIQSVNLSPQLKQIVKIYCEKQGISVSEYVRRLLFSDLKDNSFMEFFINEAKEEIKIQV